MALTAAAPAQEIKLTLADQNSPTGWGPAHALYPWIKQVEEATKGRVKIEVFPSQTLIKGIDMWKGISSGIADIGWCVQGYWPEQTPLSDVMSLPFLPIKTAEQGSEVIWKLYEKYPSIQKEYGDIQPLVLTAERLWNYETKFRGEETMDEVDCWVLQARPRQILQGQRFFDGLIWVDKKQYNIVRMEGQAVPQIRTTKTENLFPRFTTIRKPIDGQNWFPVYTYADDTLQFRTGPQRIRLRIAYSGYKRFGAESTFTPK